MLNTKYREYFNIDEQYFPQINDSSIKDNPELWRQTYPHVTFIEMLKSMERVLARKEKRSLWVEGVYGTGKSQCVYAMKKILDAPKEEVEAYWNKFEPTKKEADLLGKLIGHKTRGIVTAYRYASGGINSPRDLFFAIQDTLKKSLEQAGLYAGESSLRESVIAWLDKPAQKRFFDDLLQEPKYSSMFSQASADEVLNALRKGGEVKELMKNIFKLADENGITALNIDADRLVAWITDVIEKNNTKIVFIWDEFSDYFTQNKESLSEFQKIAELVNHVPFFFIMVTHQSDHLIVSADNNWKKIRDRFEKVEITLPDNIAFDLIGHAFNIKPTAQSAWDGIADDFNNRVATSRQKVMEAARISYAKVMKDIMPIHPMAALLLKNIAAGFGSNQRSMFNFIKSSNIDEKAFQWFIENYGPHHDHPLLTVDMLWNFFYEKGRDNLTSDIRLILDTFPQQHGLREDESAVLKAVLIMQAIDQRTGGAISLFKPTEQNLSYVFEGVQHLDGTAAGNIAKGLKNKGILVANPIAGGQFAYGAAVLAGDQAKIDKHKEDISKNTMTAKLVNDGGLSAVLPLSPALRLRFESEPNTGKLTPITRADYKRTINVLSEKSIPVSWNFYSVIAFAKDEAEAVSFRKEIKEAVADKQYENIVFIDALSTPLGEEAFEQYADFSAMALYYQGNNNASSRESSDKARRILDQEWKNRIYNGQIIVYTHDNQEGEKLANGQGVASVLQSLVIKRFSNTQSFDFTKGLTENQFKLTNSKSSAKSGVTQTTSGVVVGIEKHLLPTVWKVESYWANADTTSLPIAKLKREVDELIENAFAKEGRIDIGDIYDELEKKGFAPSNLSAFVAGFLLKEYGCEPYRYVDSQSGQEPMSAEKLSEMIGNYITEKSKGKSPKSTYIVKMTAEEMAFYELTQKVWNIPASSCSSVGQAAVAIQNKMRVFGLPVWCLEEVDKNGVFDIVKKYIELVQKEGKDTLDKTIEIGKIAIIKPSVADSLAQLLMPESCQNGMLEFLRSFENGKVLELAKSIGAEGSVIADIRRLFDGVKHSSLWDKQTGEDEIRKLLIKYAFVRESNLILNEMAHSLDEAYKKWRDSLRFVGVSHESLAARFPQLAKLIDWLLKVYQQKDILPEQLKIFLHELETHGVEIKMVLVDSTKIFATVYEPYLDGLSDSEIAEVKGNLSISLFELPGTDCNAKVKEAAEDFRKKQAKTQMADLWRKKTNTKNPNEWSKRFRTPILSCVSEAEYEKAKKVFFTINRNWGSEVEIKDAIAFLETTTLFTVISNETKRDYAFKGDILGEYSALLPDIDRIRNILEERLLLDVYEWHGNPTVKKKIKELAEAEYNSGGSDKVLSKIDTMSDSQLKQYLKRLVKGSVTVGIEILTDDGG
jgi:hypothetical protein